ncbi:MAG: DNA repair protein RadC [Thermodesulfovibrionia bacterium]
MQYRSIKEWPEEERPRERLIRFGAHVLTTAQLLAIIIRTGNKNKSAIELGRELLDRFSLKEMEDASINEFKEIKGIGVAKIAQIKAALELGRRLLQSDKREGMGSPLFRNSHDVYEYYRPMLFGLKKERFIVAMLDSKNKLFKEMKVSDGTLTSSLVHPREVFRYAIKEAAASVIFIHNHPSGDPTPSQDDIAITNRLVDTGRIVGINVLDHVIITDNMYISLKEKGYV